MTRLFKQWYYPNLRESLFKGFFNFPRTVVGNTGSSPALSPERVVHFIFGFFYSCSAFLTSVTVSRRFGWT